MVIKNCAPGWRRKPSLLHGRRRRSHRGGCRVGMARPRTHRKAGNRWNLEHSIWRKAEDRSLLLPVESVESLACFKDCQILPVHGSKRLFCQDLPGNTSFDSCVRPVGTSGLVLGFPGIRWSSERSELTKMGNDLPSMPRRCSISICDRGWFCRRS